MVSRRNGKTWIIWVCGVVVNTEWGRDLIPNTGSGCHGPLLVKGSFKTQTHNNTLAWSKALSYKSFLISVFKLMEIKQ